MSENVSKVLTRITTFDGPSADPYDHEISLIDTTEPTNHDEHRSGSPAPSWRKLARNPTKDSVKDQLARRKYAKWQQDRQPSKTSSIATIEERGSRPVATQIDHGKSGPGTEAVDFAGSHAGDRGRTIATKRTKESKRLKEQVHEIDILYENQRGSFVCGIPLYSNSSLMPIDPAPWVNKDFKDSPVNITNAQVPDPSWEWAWKTWYVDMSHDVDEEGWQYSFSFGKNWSWHGTHPWFHSFVRRRRWLRKRVKKDLGQDYDRPGSMGAAHHLNADYFTIHSKRDRSPIGAVDGPAKTARPSSFISYPSTKDMEEPPEDVKDIASLMKALKIATIDREKIDLVKRFIDHGEEELAYLKDHIPEIMSFFIFQNSRKQLLAYLKETANEARLHREKHSEENKPEGEAEKRRINNLLAAVDAANAEIGALEFWSDRKHVLQTSDADSLDTRAISTIFDEPAPKPKIEDDPVKEIKGISENADIKEDTTQSIFSPARQASIESKLEEEKEEKGKGRAHDSEDDQTEEDTSPRLGNDSVLIPDED